jgi:L-iditol 2-dehydrogenase
MYYNNSDVRLEELPVPKIQAGEILVKIIASGLCGSDMLEWYRIKKAPIVLGHEIAGEVAEIGGGVSGLSIGDRVVVSHHVPCNTCRYCLAGNHTVCETLHTTSFAPGGFAEYVRVPRINVERGVFPLPGELSFEQGAFGEPVACVLRGQRLASFGAGQTVLVIGSGISGILHVMLARAMGAERIIATDIKDFNLKAATEFGADAVIDGREDVPALVREHNGGRAADRVVVCAEALSAFKQGLESVDRGGTVLCFATTKPDIELPIPINTFWRNSITVMPSYANSPDDMQQALGLMAEGKFDVSRMVTHRLGLAETGEGFKIMSGSEDALKVMIEPHGTAAAPASP